MTTSLKRSNIPLGSALDSLHFLLHWGCSLFWCPACIPLARPQSCPLGLHLDLIGSCCCRKPWFTREERQASDMQLCRQEREVVHHTVCVLRESRPDEQESTDSDPWLTGVRAECDSSWGGAWDTVFGRERHCRPPKFWSGIFCLQNTWNYMAV